MTRPKYSLVEIERRWLAEKKKLPDISKLKKIEVTDKYFPDTRTRLRKMTDTELNETIYKLTKKYGKSSEYSEPLTTLYLTEIEYNLYNRLPGKVLIKNVYHYIFSGRKFLLEIFTEPETNFILIEIEASTEEELLQLDLPDCAGEDVTSRKEFEGYSIALTNN